MEPSEEERRKAEQIGQRISENLLKIMDLQGEMDCLLRDVESSPFGSKNWQNVSPATKQRVVAMAAIQFLLFEPADYVEGNDKLKSAADELVEVLVRQLKSLTTTEPGE